MKNIYKTSFFLIFVVQLCISQTMEQVERIFPGSPEASAIAEYAKIPVSLYTGVADINLPLLELKGKEINLPVTLSYHSAGNKVNEVSSSVGLGWVLNAGGAITRVVRGKPDDLPNGYLGTDRRGLNVSSDFNALKPNYSPFSENVWDAQPDIYYFNFLGFTGRFTLNANGEVIMTPERDFKITPAFGFNPSSSSSYWTIIDKKGNKFKFGVSTDAREQSKSITTFGNSSETTDIYNSTWYLSSIETPTGDSFNFEYFSGGDINFKTKLELYTECDISGYGEIITTTDVFNQKTLKKISSRFGHIDVTGISDRADLNNASRITELRLYNHSNLLIKTVELNHSYFNSKENCSTPECKRLKLESVDEKYNFEKSIKKYVFAYNTVKLPRRDSPEIDHWGYYNANSQPNLISRISPYDINIHRTPNESAAKASILEKITYATGGDTQFVYGLNEYRSGSVNSQSGGLRVETIVDNGNLGNTIVKNYNYFEENTTVSSGSQFSTPLYKNDFIFVDSEINPATNYSNPNPCYGYRTQSSSLNELFDLNGSPISYSEVVVNYADGTKEINKFTDLLSNNDLRSPVDYFSTFSRYQGSTATTDIIEQIPPLGSPYGPPSIRNAYQRGLLSEKVIRDASGNMIYQQNNKYEIDNTNLKTTYGYMFSRVYSYNEYVPNPSPYPPPSILNAVEVKNNVCRYSESNRNFRISQSIEKTFDGANEYNVITNYSYSSSRPTLLKQYTTELSNGDTAKTIYTYPFEFSGAINSAFTQNNQISDYMRKTDYINNEQLNYEERIFGYNTFGYINNGGIPLPKQINFKKKDLNTYTNLVVDRYDSYGNILQYHGNDNIPISILWGYGDRYPVAKVVNATYDDITDSSIGLNMGIINSISPNDTSLRTEIDKIRTSSSLSAALVTGFTFKPLIGLTSTTDTRNYTTYYYYDDFNRLQYVKDNDTHLVTENQYNYIHQNN